MMKAGCSPLTIVSSVAIALTGFSFFKNVAFPFALHVMSCDLNVLPVPFCEIPLSSEKPPCAHKNILESLFFCNSLVTVTCFIIL